MNHDRALVELTIRYGVYGQQQKTVAVPISEALAIDLLSTVERSDEPLSLMLASPGMFGGKGNAVTHRQRTFKMRREIANEIARAMVPELLAAFGVNDELDGYKIDGMSDDERDFHRKRGPACSRSAKPK